MRVMIPASVDVKYLVGKLNLSPTRKENVKNKLYYFLSLFVLTNENYSLNEKNECYRRISSVLMKKMMGRKDYYLILQLLTDPKDSVIESNKSWHNGKQGGSGYCKGYRLCQPYNTDEVLWRTIPAKFQRRVEKHIKKKVKDNFDDSKYQFLYKQLDNNKLRFDTSVYDYIYSFGQQLLSRADGNEFQSNMVYNRIGRWLYYVEKIENDNIWRQVSPANWRLNSSLTHLNHTLRPFLLYNGKRLVEVDVKASQPYILTAVMREEFITGNGGLFNLQSISPISFQKLLDGGYINSYSRDNTYSFGYTSYSGTTMHTEFNPDPGYSTGDNKKTISFMWGSFYNDMELESIRNYQNAPFGNDFYKYLVSIVKSKLELKTQDEDVLRERIKKNMRLVLFDDNKDHRRHGTYLKMFKELYPGVEKWTYDILKRIGKKEFSYLLQRAESYIVLDVISRNFHENFPSVPIFTIHDAICTYPEYIQPLVELTNKHFTKIIGTPVGLKIKPWQPEKSPSTLDINEEWAKIKPVVSFPEYKKKERTVFSPNVERGREFLL
ncbi:MAG: hypothetical protein JW894_13265 [Bacteroidales bacterium]|nr:hypothetical protein [Bacteroidales bacterium]